MQTRELFSKLRYSIEQLIHFMCVECGHSWAMSGSLPSHTTCPKCRYDYLAFENVSAEEIVYCPKHRLWTEDGANCPICEQNDS